MTKTADLRDLISHKAAWRRAMEEARDRAGPPGVDHDDRGYWTHEIEVFDRTIEEATNILKGIGALVDPERGTGRTTAQIKDAPHGAYFVWCNDNTAYPTRLAIELGRRDLTIVAPRDVPHVLAGRRKVAVVVDHAAKLKTREGDAIEWATRDD